MQQSQRQAADAVARVLDGAALPAALVAAGADSAGPARSLVHELAYGTLRYWGTLDALVRALATKPLVDRELALLVAVALYQLAHTRAPAFAVVDQAVDAAAALGKPAAKPLVNAMLRRYLRERAALDARVQRDPVARWSYPAWWIDRVRADYPERWEAILAAGNERPPLALRANVRRTTRDALLARFAAAGIAAHAGGTAGIIVEAAQDVTTLPGFAEGEFSVQDLGAQLAAPLLDIANGMRVLDACAAPGGKTAHLLDTADVDVVALDIDGERLLRIRDNLTRLRLGNRRVAIVQGDAGAPASWWDGAPFDRILLDVPCTASGVVRRHPDGKWRHRAADVERFGREQARLSEAAWPLLVAGGKLLYATCSVFRAENEDRVAEFARRHPDALRETLTFPADAVRRGGQLLPSPSGASHNQDGFFYARLRKR